MVRRVSSRTNWANVLTGTRFALYFPITIAAFLQMRILAGVLFALAQLTDGLDGYVARKTGVASEAGATFDSQVDNIGLAFLLVWLILLFPALLRATWLALVIVALLVLTQLVLARVKLGVWTGLHLWSDKLAAITASVTIVLLFFVGDVSWTRTLWSVTLGIGILSMVEGIAYLLKGGKNIDARWFGDD